MAKYLIQEKTLNDQAEQVQRLKGTSDTLTPQEQIDFLATIDRKASADLTVTGPTVTVPKGYYPDQMTKTVPVVDRGITTLQVTSSNDTTDTITLTARNTQGTGYIIGSTEISSVTAELSVTGPTARMAIDTRSVSTTIPTAFLMAENVTVPITRGSASYINGSIRVPVSGSASIEPYVLQAGYAPSTGFYYQTGTASASSTITLSQTEVRAADTNISSANIKSGVSILGVSGTFTNDANATAGQILSGKTAYVSGAKITGNIPTKSGSDLTASGAVVSVPSGYYASNTSKTVATVARATTTLTGSTDTTNAKITYTAGNNQGTGYVMGSNSTTQATVSLSVSGPTVTASDGTRSVSKTVATAARADTTISAVASDDTNDTITVRGSNAQATGYVDGATKTADITATLTTAGPIATMTIGSKSVSRAVANGSVSVPSTSLTSTPTISVSSGGLISVSHSNSTSVSPTLTTGWITSGASGTFSASGSNTQQLPTQSGTTITPGTTQKTAVSSGKYTTGTVYVAGDSNLAAGNIKSGVSIFGVTGTYSGGSGGPLVYAIDNLIRGFYKLPNNYYVSINRTNNSISRCRIGFYVPSQQNIVISTWQESELSFDYLHFSYLDSTSEWTNCKGEISKTVTYENVSAGTHFIEIWYEKDGSQFEGEDYGAFMINNAVCALETTLTVDDRDPAPGGEEEDSLLNYPVTDWEYGYNNGYSSTDGYSDVTNWEW